MISSVASITRMAKYPCGVCFLNCTGKGDIACDVCDKWFHKKCENLTNAQFKILVDSEFDYACSSCSSYPDKTFNFGLSLDRLHKALKGGKLAEYIKVEQVLLRSHKMDISKFTFPYYAKSNLFVDQIWVQITNLFQLQQLAMVIACSMPCQLL